MSEKVKRSDVAGGSYAYFMRCLMQSQAPAESTVAPQARTLIPPPLPPVDVDDLVPTAHLTVEESRALEKLRELMASMSKTTE